MSKRLEAEIELATELAIQLDNYQAPDEYADDLERCDLLKSAAAKRAASLWIDIAMLEQGLEHA